MDLPSESEPVATIKYIARLILVGVIIVFTIVGGCTAHSNTYDADRKRAEAEYKAEAVKGEIARAEAEQAKIETIRKMTMDGGINPIAARCAVEGWNDRSDTCKLIGIRGENSSNEYDYGN
jgi:hypothetical protein